MEEMPIEYNGRDLYILFEPKIAYDNWEQEFYYPEIDSIYEITTNGQEKQVELDPYELNDIEEIMTTVITDQYQRGDW